MIYCRKNISGGITKLNNNHSDLQWLKLDKSFFGLESDLYICVCYIKPENSVAANEEDIFEIMSQDLDKYSTLGQIMLLGDLNSRVGQRQEDHFEIDPDDVTTEDFSSLRYVCEVVSRRASFMASAGITALLKKMDYKDVVIAIDGSLFR